MKETKSNGLEDIVSRAIEEMKSEQGNSFSLDRINLAELERRTGVSRAKLRRLKKDNFEFKVHALVGRKAPRTVLTGYTAILDDLLKKGITNSAVCLERLRAVGFPGGQTTVKDYIAAHKYLVPAKRQARKPLWQKNYEAFMKTVGFQTKICKPRHPFTKGKVERLVRFVKENFLAGRAFWNITDLNRAALN